MDRVVELGPLGTVPVASGSISNDGLAGTSDLAAMGLNRLNAEFLLRSNGLPVGACDGRLGLAGLDLVADVRLDNGASWDREGPRFWVRSSSRRTSGSGPMARSRAASAARWPWTASC